MKKFKAKKTRQTAKQMAVDRIKLDTINKKKKAAKMNIIDKLALVP